MEFSSINIQGNIVSSEILNKVRNEDIKFQASGDFGLDRKTVVRDEIGNAWAAARSFYTAFRLRVDRLKESDRGTTETRSSWMLPILSVLGYEVETATTYTHPDTQKTYAISHRDVKQGDFPIHIVSINDDLDKRRESGARLSPHSLTQEYLNNTDHVYALVTNGHYLRVLRDATRLVRLSYLEFDLVKMMEEELYADFAIMYRTIHATRMPKSTDEVEASPIEFYHQDSLASGSRIRDKLSVAVEDSIKQLANGFLKHADNVEIRERAISGGLLPADYYLHQLRLIYRFLFLIVTEERNLVYPNSNEETVQQKRKIYYDFYSIERLRRMAIKSHFVDGRKHDLWEGVKATFRLFEDTFYGEKLGISALGSGIFSANALVEIADAKLDNNTLLGVIRNLTLFQSESGQLTRVNYSDLDVEEFGSVYEGLLEYDAAFTTINGMPTFAFVQGASRSKSGAHYTPEELVKPLIKHSLDYQIEDKLKEADKEAALLSLRVADVACGSGHILLSAARRIAFELACVRETNASGGRYKVEQPSPKFFRGAIRDAIKHCIYGVDKNPLAVELCKVALWLEAHNPGEPLNFLDHHIKCGDAIVGLGRMEELTRGIADEAFKALTQEEKDGGLASVLLKNNKKERGLTTQKQLSFEGNLQKGMDDILRRFRAFDAMPEGTPAQVEAKQRAYTGLLSSDGLKRLSLLANLQLMPFFLAKTVANKEYLKTNAAYFAYLRGDIQVPYELAVKLVNEAQAHSFFHYFLEFPEVFQRGGFDCILGNPPFLGGQKLSGTFGDRYLESIKYLYKPIGAVDLVTYFFRRNYNITKQNGFISLISTNTIAQGRAREDGLDVITQNGGTINHAVKSMRWPGVAAVEVSLVTLHKGGWNKNRMLDSKEVEFISSYLDDTQSIGNPFTLKQNEGKSFQGSIVLGKGFVLEPEEVKALIAKNPKNRDVLFPYLNGEDLNSNPDQSPSRWVINFFDWEDEFCRREYPDCFEIVERLVKPERMKMKGDRGAEYWWQFLRMRSELYSTIAPLERVIVQPRVTNTDAFCLVSSNVVFSDATVVFAFEKYFENAILLSCFHHVWSWNYSSSMKRDRRYSPSDCFETFPFPQKSTIEITQKIEQIGMQYHEHRRQLMQALQMGLTKTYNQFHNAQLRKLTPEEQELDVKRLEKAIGKESMELYKHLAKTEGTIGFNEAVGRIVALRELHTAMDNAVLEAYGWDKDAPGAPTIALRHGFYEVEYLSENDRVRYTIHPEARKEVLKRLLDLNYQLRAEEEKAGLWDKKKPTAKAAKANKAAAKKDSSSEGYGGLFG